MLFGWLSTNPAADVVPTLTAMAASLRTAPAERSRLWTLPGFGSGVLESATAEPVDNSSAPDAVRSADGASLWMSGEAFDWPSGGLTGAAESRGLAFRQRLLDAIRLRGAEAIRDLDGEYQIAVWNPASRTLLLCNDRFAALSIYTARSADGVAFAGGVRGVLMAPGIAADPDLDAIRQAVTFGGYRLGTRTNIRGVAMAPPASSLTITAHDVSGRRYWNWSELPEAIPVDRAALLEQTRGAWRAAVAKRLEGSARPGLTLSGGLDSRAILAEASARGARLSALTYGVAESDDVRIAARAAKAAGARWTLFPLYADGWLERRAGRIQETDGLINLVDLMHAEPVAEMPSLFDTYLSGYIGDAVTGSTLFSIHNAADLVASMPYFGSPLGLSYADALACAEQILGELSGPPRYAPFEHKLVQSTNRITDAARPFVRVRRPFVAYAFFEIAQRIPASWRVKHAWHERWLRSTYPELFARIPNQRTAVPIESSWVRWQLTRTIRFGWRHTLDALRRRGVNVVVPERAYHPDHSHWSQREARQAIEETILRSGSLSCDVFGRERVRTTLGEFFDAGQGAIQVVASMYVFEHYHRSLASFLLRARERSALVQC